MLPHTYIHRFPSTCLLEKHDSVLSPEYWAEYKERSQKQLKLLAAQGIVDESILQGQEDEEDALDDTVSYPQLCSTIFTLI